MKAVIRSAFSSQGVANKIFRRISPILLFSLVSLTTLYILSSQNQKTNTLASENALPSHSEADIPPVSINNQIEHTSTSLAGAPSVSPSESVTIDTPEIRPPSLTGTDVPAQFKIGLNGHLMINQDIRHIFDYFLSAYGEIDQASIIKLIHQYIDAELNGQANVEAHELLLRYIDYHSALVTLNNSFEVDTDKNNRLKLSSGIPVQKLKELFLARQNLRETYLGAESKAAFYDDEEAYDIYHLDRLSIITNGVLSEQEKQFQINQLLHQLPSNLRENQQQVHALQTYKNELKELSRSTFTNYQKRETVAEMVGEEAANRIIQTEQKNTEWHARRQRYIEQRQQIIRNNALAATEKNLALMQLQNDMALTSRDLLRIEALDRIERTTNL